MSIPSPAHRPRLLALAALAGLGLTSATSRAAVVSFYTDSGFEQMTEPDANSWGTANKTNSSVIFEVYIDYTTTVANATDPFTVFEIGADAIGSGIAIDGNNILFAAGGGSVANTAVATGPHGLTAGRTGVQIVAALEIDAGSAGNELLALYVDGSLVASADSPTNGDWAGANQSHLGIGHAFSIFEYVPSLNPLEQNNLVFAGDYPDQTTTITFAAYELGVGDNSVQNILVPEPGSLALLGLGGLMLARRRRTRTGS